MALKHRLTALLAGSALGIGMIAPNAFAQGGTEVELDRIVVQGDKAQKEGPEQDKTTTKVSRTVLQQRMAEDFEDVGRRVDAGINFNANNKSVNLRGLDDDRVLTTVDGIRIPWLADPRDSAKGGINSVDFDSLSSLDIARGADSSRYGSGALGGVVQLRTLSPEDLIEEGENFGGIIKGGYNSADESWRTNAAVAGRANDTWLLVQGGYREGHETDNFGTVGDYGSTRTKPNPRDYDQENLLVKLHQYVDGGHRFGITGEIVNRDDTWHNMSGTTAAYVPGTFYSSDLVKRNRVSGEYTFDSPDKTDFVDKATIIAYWQAQQLNAVTDAIRQGPRPPTGVFKRNNELSQDGFGLVANAEKEIVLGELSHHFRFGGDGRMDDITQYSAGVDNCPTPPPPFSTCSFLGSNHSDMPDVSGNFIGLFVEDDIKLYNDRLTLTPGVRFDWYDFDPSSTPEFEDSPTYDPALLVSNSDYAFSPKLRAAFEATENVELFAQWAQGFKAPSALELYGNYGNFGNYVRLGNPELKAETSNGLEAGATFKDSNYSVTVNGFANFYKDFIETVPLTPPPPGYAQGFGAINTPRAEIFGAEVRGQVEIDTNWRAWGSLAWSQGTGHLDLSPALLAAGANPKFKLSSVAPLRAILGVGYSAENWGVDLSATLSSSRKGNTGVPSFTLNGSTLTTTYPGFKAPGYGIVDASVWWQPTRLKGLKLQAGVYNIFDQKYWNVTDVPDGSTAPADRLTEAGRSFRLAITQKF